MMTENISKDPFTKIQTENFTALRSSFKQMYTRCDSLVFSMKSSL
jgi:hypothetical protein